MSNGIRDHILCLPSVFCQSDIVTLIEHVCICLRTLSYFSVFMFLPWYLFLAWYSLLRRPSCCVWPILASVSLYLL